METARNIMVFWPILIGFIAGLIWLVRLEAKSMYLEKSLDEHKDDYKREARDIFTKLSKLEILLAEINGKLQYLKQEE